MKHIIYFLLLSIFLSGEVNAQAYEIKIDKGQDPDSMYIMLSDNLAGKYRQGRGKWFNYLNWKQALTQEILDSLGGGPGGGENMANTNLEYDADREYDVNSHAITYEELKYWIMHLIDPAGSEGFEGYVEFGPQQIGFNTYYAAAGTGFMINGVTSTGSMEITATAGQLRNELVLSQTDTRIESYHNTSGKRSKLVLGNETDATLISTQKVVVGHADNGTDIQSGMVSDGDTMKVFSQTGEYFFGDRNGEVYIPEAADGSEDTQLVFDDATGKWMGKPIGGGSASYESVCQCKYLHIIFNFQGESNPVVTYYKSNLDFDFFDAESLGEPIVTRDSEGSFSIKSTETMVDKITSLVGATSISTRVSVHGIYMDIQSYDTSSVGFSVWNVPGGDIPFDPTSFYTGEFRIEYPID